MSGFFHLYRFQGSSLLQCGSVFHSFLCQIIFYRVDVPHLLIYSSVQEHRGWRPFFALDPVNSDLINVTVHVFVCTPVFHPSASSNTLRTGHSDLQFHLCPTLAFHTRVSLFLGSLFCSTGLIISAGTSARPQSSLLEGFLVHPDIWLSKCPTLTCLLCQHRLH